MIESEAIAALRAELGECRRENAALRAALDGRTADALSWLQCSRDRQRKALSTLQRRVVNQRAVLRVLESLGRGLTRSEWEEHIALRRDAETDESLLVA